MYPNTSVPCMLNSLILGAPVKAVFILSLLLVGCIEAPPSGLHNDVGTPDMSGQDMSRPDMNIQDMAEPNNIAIDVGLPDLEPDLESDIPIQDMEADVPEPVDPVGFNINLLAPGTSFPQSGIPLWVRVRNIDELENYLPNSALINAGTPTQLSYLFPANKTLGFWVKWPSLTGQQTSIPVRIDPGQPSTDEALWSDFKHVWHMNSTPNRIPSSKGGIDLNPAHVPPGLSFLGGAFRGYAEADGVNVGQEFTIMFWFRYEGQDISPMRILSLNEGASSSELRLDLVQNYIRMSQGGLSHNHQTSPLEAGKFYHIVLARTSNAVSIRVNGIPWGSNGSGGDPSGRQETFKVQLGQEGKDLAFAELWMAQGSISEERLVLLYRNQVQGISGSQDAFVVTHNRP